MSLLKFSKKYFGLENKIIIVTGGSGLMGKKHAEAIMEFGGIPILLDVNDEEGLKVQESLNETFLQNCEYISCNITKQSEIEDTKIYLLSKYNKIDGLINNAAVNPKYDLIKNNNESRLENINVESWNQEISVGLTGAMLCSKIFGYEMSKNKGGVIINVSSDLGLIAPNQNIYKNKNTIDENQPVKPVSYSVIKHGLIGLTKYLSTYWNDKGVRCNAICPGGIYTGQDKAFVNDLINLIPMGRMANENEYKATIIYLLSDASKYMTGSNLIIDGGRTAW